MIAIMTATVMRASKITNKNQTPVTQNAAHGDARTLVDQSQRTQREDASKQIEAEEIEQDEADREEHRPNQRLTSLHGNGDREGCRKRQDGAGHVGSGSGYRG
jgi:hypothetical protein